MRVVVRYPQLPTAPLASPWLSDQRVLRLARLAWWPALALLLLYAVSYVLFAGQLIAYPYGIDQGEGYDTWSAWLVRLGQLPYAPNDAFPYYSSNYPPLWSAIAALPMALLGPSLGAARAISTLSGLVAAALVGLAAYRRTQVARSGSAAFAGLLATAIFLASPYVFHTTPLARVNATALMFSLLALTLVQGPTWPRVGLASLALVAALFTKPTALDAVVAALIFLALVSPRRVPALAILVAVPSVAAFAALMERTQGTLWLNIVAGNANPLDLPQLGTYLLNLTATHGLFLGLAFLETWFAIRTRHWSPWVLFFLVSLVMALSVGKWGAGESYLLGLVAATSVLAGHALASLPARPRVRGFARGLSGLRRRGAPGGGFLGIALLLQLFVMAHGPLSDAISWLPDRGVQAWVLGQAPSRSDREEADTVAARVRAQNAPVLSEEPSFVLAAGKPVVGNATHLRNLYQAGLWDPSALVADLRARRYGLVILSAQLYPQPVLDAIGRAYYLDQEVTVGGARYYVFLPGGDTP